MARLIIALAFMSLVSAGCSPNKGTAADGSAQADVNADDHGGEIVQSLADFATSTEGFGLAEDENPANLTVLNGGNAPSLAWTDSEGNPDPGSVQIVAQYLVDGRYVDGRHIRVEKPIIDAMKASVDNWRGRKLAARFRVGVGLESGSEFPGHATLYVSTVDQRTGVVERSASTVGIAAGNQWQTVVHAFGTDFSAGPMAAFGLILELRRGGREVPNTPDPSPSVFYVDTFSLE